MSGHFLVVHAVAEDPEDWEWEVEHPEPCQWDALVLGSDGHVCAVGAEIDNAGLDGLEGWEKLAPGKYEIRFWSRRYQTAYGVELDAGLEFVATDGETP